MDEKVEERHAAGAHLLLEEEVGTDTVSGRSRRQQLLNYVFVVVRSEALLDSDPAVIRRS